MAYHRSRKWFLDAAINWQHHAAKYHAAQAEWLALLATGVTEYRLRRAIAAQASAAHAADMAEGYIAFALAAED